MEMKTCIKCGDSYPKTHEYFGKVPRPCKFRADCRKCNNEYAARRRDEKREQVYEATRQWRANNKDRVKHHNQKYKTEHPQYFKDHWQKYYEEKKPVLKVNQSVYRLNNKDKTNFHRAKRKTRLKSLEFKFSYAEWRKTLDLFGNKCAYCGSIEKLSKDHFVALSRGGEFTKNNIIPACISCNCSKQEFDFFEWYPRYRHYSKQREERILKYLNYKSNTVQQLALI